MSDYQRDRAGGWQYAKMSGHGNEQLVKALLDQDTQYAKQFLQRIGCAGDAIAVTNIGGLHETNVPSVLGRRKTKSKTDLKVFLQSGNAVSISIKKSLAGQVYLVGADSFIKVFEKQFGRTVPAPVRRAMQLFWCAADDAETIIAEYADRSSEKQFQLQMHHKSLNAETLKAYDSSLYDALLRWMMDNAREIALLCFSKGAARDRAEWSDFVWYKNLLGENDTDAIFPIHKICAAVKSCAKAETYYSAKNGGTTIQLPFGFVQWHQRKMQFHHQYEKLY